MSNDAVIAEHPAPALVQTSWRRWLFANLASLARFFVGVVLCLNPVTAIIVLGWLMRLMADEHTAARAHLKEPGMVRTKVRLPRWVAAPAGSHGTTLRRALGSLAENLTLGLKAFAALTLATLPFTALWLLSWWAGWENSFNKGYEQAWVGPTVGLLGVALALPMLARIPIALAHQAANECRISAFFAWGKTWRMMRAVGWRYTGLALLIVLAAVPVFAANGLPVFVEHWRPGFAERSPEAVHAFASDYRFVATAYILAALILLRRYAARLHARADHALISNTAPPAGARAWLSATVQTLLVLAIWFGFVAQIYVGQFINHQWVSWLTHPMFALPWIPPLGVAM